MLRSTFAFCRRHRLTVLAVAAFAVPYSASADTVRVLYAGSLVHTMEQQIGPAFEKATGIHFEGYAGGSNLLAQQVEGGLRQGDVFISAATQVDTQLMAAEHGNWLSWYIPFATSPLLIGYSPQSRFRTQFQQLRWDQALSQPGLRLGRSDPKLDPKGRFVMEVLTRAEKLYGEPGLAQRVTGGPENPVQILPEEVLVGRLQSGQLDAGFFYSIEARTLKLPVIALPAEVAIGATYTVGILKPAADNQAATRFVAFLLGPQGQQLLHDAGFELLPGKIEGAADQVPALIKTALPKPSP